MKGKARGESDEMHGKGSLREESNAPLKERKVRRSEEAKKCNDITFNKRNVRF